MDNGNGNNLYILNVIIECDMALTMAVNYVCIHNITPTVVDIHICIIYVRTALYIHEQAVKYGH